MSAAQNNFYAKNASASAQVKGFVKTAAADMEDHTAVLSLNKNGMIRDCNKAGDELLGSPSTGLTWQHISTLLPQLKITQLMRGQHLNPHLCFLSRVGHYFDVVRLNGEHFIGELYFSEVGTMELHSVRVIIRQVEQKHA